MCQLIFQEKPLINHGGGEKEKKVSLVSPDKRILVDVINERKPGKASHNLDLIKTQIGHILEIDEEGQKLGGMEHKCIKIVKPSQI